MKSVLDNLQLQSELYVLYQFINKLTNFAQTTMLLSILSNLLFAFQGLCNVCCLYVSCCFQELHTVMLSTVIIHCCILWVQVVHKYWRYSDQQTTTTTTNSDLYRFSVTFLWLRD